MESLEEIRLELPVGWDSEGLAAEWGDRSVIRAAGVRKLTFWDTFEWGLWFRERVLFSEKGYWRLCRRDGGWIGEEICGEERDGVPRFSRDFHSSGLREGLQTLMGLRGLAPVVSATIRQRAADFRNEMDKTVCRIEWIDLISGRTGGEAFARYCRILPLRGYASEAAAVADTLKRFGAESAGEGPMESLLRSAGRIPRAYTLRPRFGLEAGLSAREAVGLIVRSVLSIARVNEEGIRADLDTEFLHDYRVCLRKIRSVLSLIKGVYPDAETLRCKAILGALARATNRLRDLDVYLLAREDYLQLVPPVFRPALEEMFRDFEIERSGVLRKVRAHLRSPSRKLMIRELEGVIAGDASLPPSPESGASVGPLVFRRIYKRYRRVCGIAAGMGPDTPDEAVHGLRIECKKLRYLLEFFAEIVPQEEGEVMGEQLRRLQSRLGEFNDCSVQEKFLLDYWQRKKMAVGAEVSDIALSLGALVAMLHHRRQEQRDRIWKALGEFCGASTAAMFKRTFKIPSLPTAGEGGAQ